MIVVGHAYFGIGFREYQSHFFILVGELQFSVFHGIRGHGGESLHELILELQVGAGHHGHTSRFQFDGVALGRIPPEETVTPGETVHGIGVREDDGWNSLRKGYFLVVACHFFQLPLVGGQRRLVARVAFASREGENRGDHH